MSKKPLPYYRCQNCGAEYPYGTDFGDEIPHFWERHSEGDMVGAGECLDETCGALVFPIADLDRVKCPDAFFPFMEGAMGEFAERGYGTQQMLKAAIDKWNKRVYRRRKAAEKST